MFNKLRPHQVDLLDTKKISISFADVRNAAAKDNLELPLNIFDVELDFPEADEIFNKIQSNGQNCEYIIKCLEHALVIRPKRREVINYLLSKIVKMTNHTPEVHFNKETKLHFNSNGYYLYSTDLSEECTLEKVIFDDDVEKLINATKDPSFEPNKIIDVYIYKYHQKLTYMQLMAYFGSIKCFKYALMDGSFDLNDISHYAIAGGNVEIIHLLEQKGVSFDKCFRTSIAFNRDKISDWLMNNYKCEAVELYDAIACYNSRAFFILFNYEERVNSDKIETALAKACSTGNINVLKFLWRFKNNSMINWFNKACKNGNLEIMKYLHEEGATKCLNENDKYNLLNDAAESGNRDLVKYLIEDLSFEPSGIISTASKYKRMEVVKYLVEVCHVNVEDKNNSLYTALHYAGINDNYEMVTFLIKECHANFCDRYFYCSSYEVKEFVKLRCSLHEAAERGDLEAVKNLVERRDYSVEQKYNEKTPLSIACSNSNTDIVKYLVESCHASFSDDDIINSNEETKEYIKSRCSLHEATERCDLEAVKKLIEQENYFVEQVYNGCTPLSIACKKGFLELVKYFIEVCHADFEKVDYKGRNSLICACYSGNLDLVKYLIEEHNTKVNSECLFSTCKKGSVDVLKYLVDAFKLDYNIKNSEKITPLLYACRKNNLPLVKYLIEELHVKVEHKTKHLKFSCLKDSLDTFAYLVEELHYKVHTSVLHFACKYNNNVEIIKQLINKYKLDPKEERDIDGKDALVTATEYGNINIVHFLIEECKMDANKKYKNMTSLLHFACCSGNIDLVKYFFKDCKLSVYQKDRYDNSVLHFACKSNNVELVNLLVSYFYIDSDESNQNLQTPLLIALNNGNDDVAKYLIIECKSDIEKNIICGDTALIIAIYANRIEIVKYLIEECHANILVRNYEQMSVLDCTNDFEIKSYLKMIQKKMNIVIPLLYYK